MPPLKRCSTCRRRRRATSFARDRSSPDGLQRRCRDCYAATRQARRTASRCRRCATVSRDGRPRGRVAFDRDLCKRCLLAEAQVRGLIWCVRCRRELDPASFKLGLPRQGLPWCSDCANGRRRQQRYGLSVEDQTALLQLQGGGCAICGRLPATWHLGVDHDHSCCSDRRYANGQYRTCGRCTRGLLCPDCNRALGLLRDSPELLRAAASYLESPPARQLRGGT